MYNGLCDILNEELEQIEKKMMKGGSLNTQDLDNVDKIAHALKSLATYEAMTGGYSEYGGGSYYGRSRMGSRYSREGRQVEYGKETDPYYDRR